MARPLRSRRNYTGSNPRLPTTNGCDLRSDANSIPPLLFFLSSSLFRLRLFSVSPGLWYRLTCVQLHLTLLLPVLGGSSFLFYFFIFLSRPRLPPFPCHVSFFVVLLHALSI